jgi:hypothetical protein
MYLKARGASVSMEPISKRSGDMGGGQGDAICSRQEMFLKVIIFNILQNFSPKDQQFPV